MAHHGIRYVVVGLGCPDEPATDEDVEVVREYLEREAAPFKAVAISDRASTKLTMALLDERRL